MKITIACVGKMKERHYAEAAAEYAKRLTRYADIELRETRDEPFADRPSPAEAAAVLAKEGGRLLAACPPKARKIALAIDGRAFASEGFSAYLGDMADSGIQLCFIIGGTLGLSEAVLSAADDKLSLSTMTLPHQLARVVLLEQIYRAYRILKGEPYHK